MDPLTLLAALPLMRRALVGLTCERVQPVERTGLHLHFAGTRAGLRLDTAGREGAALVAHDAPPRIRGGRSSWIDIAGAADRLLAGRELVGIDMALAPLALRALFSGDAVLGWVRDRGGPRLYLQPGAGAGLRFWPVLGADENPPELPAGATLLSDLPAVARRWRAASGALPPDDPGFLERLAALSGLGPRRLERLAREQGGLAELAHFLESLADHLDGDVNALAFDEGRVRLAESSPVPDADALASLESWYRRTRADLVTGQRRDEAREATVREIARIDRALAALDRESEQAPDPETLRRRGGALLAAGAGAVTDAAGRLSVPDPWEPESAVVIEGEKPGTKASAIAEKLFTRARKEERGRETRASRRAALTSRRGLLEEGRSRLEAASDSADLDAALALIRDAGLAVGLERPKPAVRESAAPARVFRSPSGFEVIAGRTARQNDRLTFKIAAPDDYWFHVEDYPGAHVVLRLAGRAADAPAADQEFAARIAAAFSQAPAGISVDVHVTRRKHVRKPKGAPPGSVLVRKARTIRVAVAPPPADV